MKFKNLHEQSAPLLICNVWDVASTKVAERLNFKAVGTSSAAIATMLGYNDGEEMSFSELEYLVKCITQNTDIPLTVDLESGYSREPSSIANNIKRLADLGVVGINIEDTIVESNRTFLDAEQFAKTITHVKTQLRKENIDIFLNVRTDSFLLGHSNPVEESLRRIRLYENAGADGIFVPCIVKEADIKSIVESTSLPINVMCMPTLPDFEKLKALGVKRISMGNFLFDNMYKKFEQRLGEIATHQSFKSIF